MCRYITKCEITWIIYSTIEMYKIYKQVDLKVTYTNYHLIQSRFVESDNLLNDDYDGLGRKCGYCRQCEMFLFLLYFLCKLVNNIEFSSRPDIFTCILLKCHNMNRLLEAGQSTLFFFLFCKCNTHSKGTIVIICFLNQKERYIIIHNSLRHNI
jgi:hypothetical protein